MSGLCGVFGGRVGEERDALTSMLERIRYRGPDGMNTYLSAEADCLLGHLHLNAFAPMTGAIKPAFAETEEYVVGLDGGVTNRDELLSSFHPAGDSDQHHPDVLAVIAAYERLGDPFLHELDGPFSLFFWDKKKRQLVLSRDKLGEKTLYYYNEPGPGGSLMFGSEVRAILAHPRVRPELDLDSLSLYFAFGYIPGPKTLFKGIYKLLPGESLRTGLPVQPQRTRYWHLPPIADGLEDESFCINKLKELFMQGLQRYVNGCTDVAVFLSGGVDSSIIVAALRELGVPRIYSVTAGFKLEHAGAGSAEDLRYARMVAEKFGTIHKEVVFEPGHDPGKAFLDVIEHFDDLVMTPNTYSKHLLAEAVHEMGLNSVLTGSAAAGACGVHRKFLDHKKRRKLLEKTAKCKTDEERYLRLRSRLFDLEMQRRILKQPPAISEKDILEVLHEYISGVQSDDFFRLFLFSNLMITSTEKTLKVLDRVGAMSSVEIRSPYLHRALVEFSTQLPSSFDEGRSYVSLKTHLKKAFEAVLPPEVLDRPVIGYPSYYWNHGELAPMQEKFFGKAASKKSDIFKTEEVQRLIDEEKHSGAKSAGKMSWALLQFSLWHEVFISLNDFFTTTIV